MFTLEPLMSWPEDYNASLKTHVGLHSTLMTPSSLEIRNFGPYASLTGKGPVMG